MNAASRGVLAA